MLKTLGRKRVLENDISLLEGQLSNVAQVTKGTVQGAFKDFKKGIEEEIYKAWLQLTLKTEAGVIMNDSEQVEAFVKNLKIEIMKSFSN